MPYKDKTMKSQRQWERRKDEAPAFTEAPIEVPKTQYPAIALALVDPVKRGKLVKVFTELKGGGLSKEVRYGVSGPTFDIVGELLEVTC